MKKSRYSSSAYGKMRERITEREERRNRNVQEGRKTNLSYR